MESYFLTAFHLMNKKTNMHYQAEKNYLKLCFLDNIKKPTIKGGLKNVFKLYFSCIYELTYLIYQQVLQHYFQVLLQAYYCHQTYGFQCLP